MDRSLKNKTVWITGGKRIGQSVAEELARMGANIVASYRSSKEEAEELVSKARTHNVKTLVLQCDVSNRESVAGAVEKIKLEFGQLDVLVLMASIFKPIKLEDISDKDFQSNFDVHVGGTFWPIQLSLPLMKSGSHIITISDRTAIGKVYADYLPYVVTKGAVADMTRALAVELGPKEFSLTRLLLGRY